MKQKLLILSLLLCMLLMLFLWIASIKETFENKNLGIKLSLKMNQSEIEKFLGEGRVVPMDGPSYIEKNEDISLFSYGEGKDIVFVTYNGNKSVCYNTWSLYEEVPIGSFNWSISGIGMQTSLEDVERKYPDGKTLTTGNITIFQKISGRINRTAVFNEDKMISLALGDLDYLTDYIS